MTNPAPPGRTPHSTGGPYKYAPRKLPIHAVIHDSVFERMQDSSPVYTPQSLIDLNKELIWKRKSIEWESNRLAETNTLNQTAIEKIQKNKDSLSPTKWSNSELKKTLKPNEELTNPAVH